MQSLSKKFWLGTIILLLPFFGRASEEIGIDPNDYKFITLDTWKIIENLNWPGEYASGDFNIYILGNSPTYKYFKTWEKTRRVDGRRIRIRKTDKLGRHYKPHIFYIPAYLDHYTELIIWQFKDQPTLIMTEMRGMIKKGAHVDFFRSHEELRFELGTGNLDRLGFSYAQEIIDRSSREFKKVGNLKKPDISISSMMIELEEEEPISAKEEAEYNNFMGDLSRLATSSKKKVKVETEDLQALLDQQKQQKAEMEKNQKEMAIQKRSISALVQEREKRQGELEEQNLILDTKHREVEKLQRKERRINADLARKEKILQGKELTIREQYGELKSHKYIIYVMAIFLAIAIVLGYFIYRNYKAKVAANKVIQEQKALVEEKNQKITDSITYAKRLQSAILPSDKIVQSYLDQSFIFYQPKDIVAGDFYWMDQAKDRIIFAAADCTGHGVPGAFVSIVCHNALNRSVREFGKTKASDILDQTRELVVAHFQESDENVKDGMDISLCCYNIKTRKLDFSGANNRLFLVRRDNGRMIMEDIKGDKQPIGQFDHPTPFTNHQIGLKKGDTVYLSTDGFPDQFGGPKGKKFMYKRFKELLTGLYDNPMEAQKNLLKMAFESWKGEEEQLDDVCVLGMRA